MEIYIVRHTRPGVGQGICYGQTDVALPAEFEIDAKKVISKIHDKADAVFSSPLLRCTLLAAMITCSIPVEIDARLLELNFGTWEMKSWDAIGPDEPWFHDYINTSLPGGESFFQLYNRVSDFLINLEKSSFQKVVIITHGGVIKAAIARLSQISLEAVIKIVIPFGSVYKFILL